MIVDYHLHPRAPAARGVEEIDFSASVADRYVEAAAARGVDEIGFTEHVYYFAETRAVWNVPYQLDRCRFSLDDYCGMVEDAKRRGLPVKLGLEADWVPARADELAELLAPYPWDYLLGSVHWIDGLAVDQRPGIWETMSAADVWRRYAGELAAAARSGHFDVLAHPDLVKIWGERVGFDWTEVVAALDGVHLEISTAGLRKPVAELYPSPELLRLGRRAGVGITLASDAHLAEDVGRDLDRALELAHAAGYDSVTVFDGREARQEPLG